MHRLIAIFTLASVTPLTHAASSVLTFPATFEHDYGSNLPDTPQVAVRLRTISTFDGTSYVEYLNPWSAGYGDLLDVAYPATDGYIGEIELIPTRGYGVKIESFDLASYLSSEIPLDTLRVINISNVVLWSQTPTTLSSQGTHSSYAPSVSFPGPLRLQFGNSWNIAIDNISFSQFKLPRLQGDTNEDTYVDLKDLNNVLNNFGSHTPGTPGDDNHDNVIDLADLNNVLNNFGADPVLAPSSLTPVPEPASLFLLAADYCLLTTFLRRRRRRPHAAHS